MKHVVLTKGFVSSIDDEDLEKVSKYRWHVQIAKKSGQVYATRNTRIPGTKKSKSIKLHRFIMNLEDPNLEIDHADGNTLNNQKYNLRICTHQQNQQNRKTGNRNRPGKYKGVKYNKQSNTWWTTIKINQKPEFLGAYLNEEFAGIACNRRAKEAFGEFANLNPIKNWENIEITPSTVRRSKYRGVYLTGAGNWKSSLKIKNIVHYIGTYPTEEKAALAYNTKAQELLSDKAKLNIV